MRLLAFVIPAAICVEVPGPATIYLAELLLIALLPILLVMRGKALQSRTVAFILLLGLLYFGAQVITDVIRETPFADYARGWSRILFLLMSFVASYLLIGGNRERLLCFVCGLAIGGIFFVLINKPLAEIGWKFGLAGPVTTLLLAGFAATPLLRSPKSLIGPAIMLALGILSGYLNFRSWGGALMLGAAFLVVPAVPRLAGLVPKPLTYGRMVVVGVMLLGTAFAALKLYGAAAESGSLGDKARDKYETQATLGDLAIILGGRSESLVTLEAIRDSPLIGHGSWAKSRYYAERRQVLLYQLGFTDSIREPKDDLIPTHSHLLGAWVEAGLGGAIFWLGILALIVAALRRLYASDDPIRPYLVFVMFLFIWDILFSPFGAQRRLTNGFFMVVVLFALKTENMDWRRRIAAIAPYAPHREWAITQPLDPRLQPTQGIPPFLLQGEASNLDEPAAKEAEEQHRDVEGPAAPIAGPDVDGDAIRAGFRRMRQQKR